MGEWSSGDVCVAFSNQDCLEIHTHEECQHVSRQKEEERIRNIEECKALSLCERHCTVRSCLASCQQTFTCLPQKPIFAAPLVILEMVEEATTDEVEELFEEENDTVGEETEIENMEVEAKKEDLFAQEKHFVEKSDIKNIFKEEEKEIQEKIEIDKEEEKVEANVKDEIAEEELFEENNEIDLKEGEKETQEENENVKVEIVLDEELVAEEELFVAEENEDMEAIEEADAAELLFEEADAKEEEEEQPIVIKEVEFSQQPLSLVDDV